MEGQKQLYPFLRVNNLHLFPLLKPVITVLGVEKIHHSIRGFWMKKKFFLFLLLIILLSINKTLADEKHGLHAADTYKKEILVAENITNVHPFWCGQRNVLIYSAEEKGLFYYDIKTGLNVNVADWGNTPLACSPDGEWLVYADKFSVRYDKGTVEIGVVDVWRHEFKTGKNQKFVIADDGHVSSAREGIFPPKGLTLYLGRRPNERMEMPEPVWEVVWSQRRSGGHLWLQDPPAIIGVYGDPDKDRFALEIEVFDAEERIITIYPEFQTFYPLLTDKQNRVYMTVEENDGLRVVRCTVDVKEEKLSCHTVLQEDGHVKGFDVLSDGETAVFTRDDDRCVRIMLTGKKKADCITASRYVIGNYVAISPDGGWMTFTANRKSDEGNHDISDLYIVELKKD